MKNETLKLDSLKDFKLSLNESEKVSGGANGTEICTQRCSTQYDCASDDGTGDYGTSAEFDACED